MDIIAAVQEAVVGGFKSIFGIALIVFPLMVVLEIIKDMKLFNKVFFLTKPISRLFNISAEAGLPILTGLIFGITYGAGAIIQSAREGALNEKDLYVVNTFLVLCHAIFEDTVLFAAIGANLYILLVFRIFVAVVITFLVSRYVKDAQAIVKTTYSDFN